jgi:hypothetical protein
MRRARWLAPATSSLSRSSLRAVRFGSSPEFARWRFAAASRGVLAGVAIASIALLACSPELPEFEAPRWRFHSTPAEDARDVDRMGRIVVEFDRLPLPNTVDRSSVRLRSGAQYAWLDLRLQPLRRELWIDLRVPLEPQVRYELEVRGLIDLDALPQPEPYRAQFETGAQLGTTASEPAPDAAQILALLAERCARSGCHGADAPAAGLDLGSAQGIEASAKNVRSQRLRGSTPRGAGRTGLLYDAAPVLIDAAARRGDPARSYLIYKLLGPDHILGDVMPPPGEPELTPEEIQRLCDWIYAGAPT